MNLFDETITAIRDLIAGYDARDFQPAGADWKEVSDRSMILRSDMAYELGGSGKPGVGCTFITENSELVAEDAITLIGKNLSEIKEDTPFARVSLVRVDADTMGEGNALYNAIRKLEYTRYHFYPEGFMLRVSSTKQRESVRIGKEALAKGLSFEITGDMMIQAFRKNPAVKAVHIYYISLADFDYKRLQDLADEGEKITKTVDHILKNVVMDCDSCNLQEVCDEVEGLRELHFAQNADNAQEKGV